MIRRQSKSVSRLDRAQHCATTRALSHARGGHCGDGGRLARLRLARSLGPNCNNTVGSPRLKMISAPLDWPERQCVPLARRLMASLSGRGSYPTTFVVGMPRCASRQNWAANGSNGSFSIELVWTKRSLRSAMPPIATEFTRHDESSRRATSGLVQCSKI
jgi:hypothetical protein